MIHVNSSFPRKNIFPSGLVCRSKPSKFDPFTRKLCNRANVDDDDGCVTKRAQKNFCIFICVMNVAWEFLIPGNFFMSRGHFCSLLEVLKIFPNSRGSDSALCRDLTQRRLHERSRAINVGHDSARGGRIFPRLCHVQRRKKFFNLGIQPKVR